MAVTLKDVAEMAGVSRSAVSRTFTEGASVSEKVRLKVMEASQALGIQPQCFGLIAHHGPYQAYWGDL